MKNFFFCPQCMEAEHEKSGPQLELNGSHFIFKSANNDGVYQLKCELGHESFHVDQSLRFQNLFQAGCFALIDGYHREAVTSFAVSLERFYEQIIRALALKSGADALVLDKAWSTVSRQTERQTGAFVYLFLREYSKNPVLLSSKETDFRNKVTHMGIIPSFDEAIQFGERVANIQRVNLAEVLEKDEQYWYKEFGKELEEKEKKVKPGVRRSSMSNPNMIFNPFFKEDLAVEINFKAKLEDIKKVKTFIENLPDVKEI